jgi:putative tryptophan/tyrosine transport system substrate-binding protein
VKTGSEQKRVSSKIITPVHARAFVACLLLTVMLPVPSRAQQLAKIPRIGFLNALFPTTNPARIEAFRQGLRDAGYVEGKNIVLEYRYAERKVGRLSALAAELVNLKVDVIVTSAAQETRAAKVATSTIPIVMINEPDPVGTGLVASLARPGGNITGLSTLSPQLSGKRLELLKEIIPKLSRVAVLGNSSNPGNADTLKELQLAAQALKVNIQYLDVPNANEIENSFREADNDRADAVLILSDSILTSRRKQVIGLAIKSRLPVSYPRPEFVESGGLMTYGVSLIENSRRAAAYVDKILKGAKPADLPIEQPTKFELIVNLKAAKQIGLTIPPNVLARADRVIR